MIVASMMIKKNTTFNLNKAVVSAVLAVVFIVYWFKLFKIINNIRYFNIVVLCNPLYCFSVPIA